MLSKLSEHMVGQLEAVQFLARQRVFRSKKQPEISKNCQGGAFCELTSRDTTHIISADWSVLQTEIG